jgi:hypothetical protein
MGREGVAGRRQTQRLAVMRNDRDGFFHERLRHQIDSPRTRQ